MHLPVRTKTSLCISTKNAKCEESHSVNFVWRKKTTGVLKHQGRRGATAPIRKLAYMYTLHRWPSALIALSDYHIVITFGVCTFAIAVHGWAHGAHLLKRNGFHGAHLLKLKGYLHDDDRNRW